MKRSQVAAMLAMLVLILSLGYVAGAQSVAGSVKRYHTASTKFHNIETYDMGPACLYVLVQPSSSSSVAMWGFPKDHQHPTCK